MVLTCSHPLQNVGEESRSALHAKRPLLTRKLPSDLAIVQGQVCACVCVRACMCVRACKCVCVCVCVCVTL